MSTTAPAKELRPYPVRTDTASVVKQALSIEQHKRSKPGEARPRLMDIAAEWLEAKSKEVVSAHLEAE